LALDPEAAALDLAAVDGAGLVDPATCGTTRPRGEGEAVAVPVADALGFGVVPDVAEPDAEAVPDGDGEADCGGVIGAAA
jgi:hypothetical protein